MAENQILPFAQGSGANVMSQTAYAGDVQRVAGNQPGIARSALVNKALRQCSAMAAGLAQYLASYQDTDITDERSAAGLAAAVVAANMQAMPIANETRYGKTRFATQDEAATLNETTCISPKTFINAFATRGNYATDTFYQMLPNGMLIQGGIARPTATPSTIQFPTSFREKCYAICAQMVESVPSQSGLLPYTVNLSVYNKNLFTAYVQRTDGAETTALRFFWIALGK